MPDWKRFVRERLAEPGMPHAAREDVIAELAAHLEETYENACSRGLPETQATARALQEVDDWTALRRKIRCAKSQENAMNYHTKTLWLPGIAILFAAGLFLVLLGRAETVQKLIWIGTIGFLWCAAVSEANHMNQRTKCFWLPGFVSLTVATLFLLAVDAMHDPFSFFPHDPSYFFTKISLQPQCLVRMDSGPGRTFYFAWLVAQILFGALGAFLSRRAGGARTTRILAGALPALITFGLFAVLVPVTFLIERKAVTAHPADFALAIFVWLVAPAITLLLGAAPFLSEPELHAAGTSS